MFEKTVADDLRARLHADHAEVDKLIHDLRSTDDHDVAMRTDLRNELVQALMVHARAEEDVVYSTLRAEPPLQGDIAHAEREHQDILRCLARLEAIDPADPGFLDALDRLADGVTHHVREEEGQVLPKAEHHLGRDALARLIPSFDERRRELLRHRHSAFETAPTEPEATPTPLPPSRDLTDAPSRG